VKQVDYIHKWWCIPLGIGSTRTPTTWYILRRHLVHRDTCRQGSALEFYDLLWDQRERKYYKGIAKKKKNHRNESYQMRINYINYIKHRLRHSAGVLRPSPLTRDIHFLTSTVSHVRSEIYSSEPAVKDLRGELGLIASNSASEWRARPFSTRSG
jgi:hypothetical protein